MQETICKRIKAQQIEKIQVSNSKIKIPRLPDVKGLEFTIYDLRFGAWNLRFESWFFYFLISYTISELP